VREAGTFVGSGAERQGSSKRVDYNRNAGGADARAGQEERGRKKGKERRASKRGGSKEEKQGM
jgi:hypothetical protein